MENKENKEFLDEARKRGQMDYEGHYVEMKTVDKNQKVWWIWNDGAITQEGYKRDKLFNFTHRIKLFFKSYGFIIKAILFFAIIYGLYLIIF